MIQFRRGTKESWLSLTEPLADGQPGYDRISNKIKVGDGTKLWSELPYASGVSAEEVLSDEAKAKLRLQRDADSEAIITYGTESPDNNTVGQLYLQYYDVEPEVDYVVGCGVDGGWSYQKWKSGIAKCYITFEFDTSIQSAIGASSLYMSGSSIKPKEYPITFIDVPSETATVKSPGGLVWLAANKGLNTKSKSASYSLISPDNLINTASYSITLSVEGRWR